MLIMIIIIFILFFFFNFFPLNIVIAVPGDQYVQQKELEKKTKYEDLRIEIARLWNKKVLVILVVVGALGTLTANLKKNLKALGIPNVIPCLQKSALLGIASILRRTLGISDCV